MGNEERFALELLPPLNLRAVLASLEKVETGIRELRTILSEHAAARDGVATSVQSGHSLPSS